MDYTVELKNLLENEALDKPIRLAARTTVYEKRISLTEIQAICGVCDQSKPFHNTNKHDEVINFTPAESEVLGFVEFQCVTCKATENTFLLKGFRIDSDTVEIQKIGQYPQKELPRSKALGRFFSNDKSDYNKAVVCLANGYGVAAFAYMRRIVENNISDLLDLIKESVDPSSNLIGELAELKKTSPMSDKIEIANQALPDYLKPDGFNPLGQIYGLLSDGVHSLPDEECLDKAQDLQACLEFLISELAAHKRNKEEFKSRLSALRKR